MAIRKQWLCVLLCERETQPLHFAPVLVACLVEGLCFAHLVLVACLDLTHSPLVVVLGEGDVETMSHFCGTCARTVGGPALMEQHVRGKKHQKKLLAKTLREQEQVHANKEQVQQGGRRGRGNLLKQEVEEGGLARIPDLVVEFEEKYPNNGPVNPGARELTADEIQNWLDDAQAIEQSVGSYDRQAWIDFLTNEKHAHKDILERWGDFYTKDSLDSAQFTVSASFLHSVAEKSGDVPTELTLNKEALGHMRKIQKHFRGRVATLNAVLLHPHTLSEASAQESGWVPEKPNANVPLHLAGKVLSSVEGITDMLGAYGTPLISAYVLRAMVQQRVAATAKRKYKKGLHKTDKKQAEEGSASSKLKFETAEIHPGSKLVLAALNAKIDKWMAWSDADLEVAVASMAVILFTVQQKDEASLQRGSMAIHHWVNKCEGGILTAVRSHKNCTKNKCSNDCKLFDVCKVKRCKTECGDGCKLCGGVIGSMKGRTDCRGIYEALQLFEHFGTNPIVIAKIKDVFIRKVTNVSTCLFEKLISLLRVEAPLHSGETVEIAVDSKVGQASMGLFNPDKDDWDLLFGAPVVFKCAPALDLTEHVTIDLPLAVQTRLKSLQVKQADAGCKQAWDKSLASGNTRGTLKTKLWRMVQQQGLATKLCRLFGLDPGNSYHVMALRELIRTVYDIESGAKTGAIHPNVFVTVVNHQVQEEGCDPGLEKGTWHGKGTAFCSLENCGISIGCFYHFW